eukprot:2538846-Rhodomonas_salina.1
MLTQIRSRRWCKVRAWERRFCNELQGERAETGLSAAAGRRDQSSGCACASAGDDDAADQAQP